MADSIEVGSIVVRLIADAKQLEAALKKGSDGLKKFGDEADKAGKQTSKSTDAMGRTLSAVATRLVGLAAAFAAVDAVIDTFNRTMANITALDQLSQATGISVERLDQLRGVALQLGIDFQTVSQAVSQFGARMTEALASGSSRGSQAIRALGIDVRDAAGNIRQLDELLPELADAFSQYADGSNKAAIASALFGEEAGPRMLALLNRGRAGLEEMRRVLRSTMTPEDVQRAREYREAVGRLQITFEELARKLTTAISPAVVIALDTITEGLDRIIGSLERLGVLSRTSTHEMQLEIDSLVLTYRSLASQVNGLTEDYQNGVIGAEEYDRQLLERQRRMHALKMEIELLTAAHAALKAGQQVSLPDSRPQASVMDPFALEKAQFALERLQERLLGTRSIFDEVNLSWQAHGELVQQTLAAIDRAHDKSHRQERARHQIERTLELQKQQQMLATATMAAQAISAIWPKQKGAAIAAAIINTAVGITNALSTGIPPWNIAQAALIAAQGAAQIATIRSTNEQGSGGGASVSAAPAAAAAPADLGRSLTIEGVDTAHLFSGGQVRGLISMINEEVRNGATLISSGRLAT